MISITYRQLFSGIAEVRDVRIIAKMPLSFPTCYLAQDSKLDQLHNQTIGGDEAAGVEIRSIFYGQDRAHVKVFEKSHSMGSAPLKVICNELSMFFSKP